VVALALLFTTSLAFSEARLTRLPSGVIRLTETCAQIANRQNELAAWTNQAEGRSCQKKPITRGKTCSVDITDCLPDHARRYQGSSAAVDGPNCFNLALMMKNVVGGFRQSSDGEFKNYLSSSLCRELDPAQGDRPQAGDVGSVEDRIDGRVIHHGFIYISPALVYSKNSQSETDPYAVQSLRGMAIANHVDGYGPPCPEDSEGCPHGQLHYFRCQNFQTFFDQIVSARKPILSEVRRRVDAIECFYQGTQFGEQVPENSVQTHITDNLQILTSYLQQQAGHLANLTSEERYVLQTMYLRLDNMRTLQYQERHDLKLSSLYSKAMEKLPPTMP